MASTAAALNGALLAAVCFVLLHSSMGQPPMPTPNCPDHTGQQPAPPPPTPIPTPTPASAPATAPAPTPTPPPPPPPTEDCYNSCATGCSTNCSTYFETAIKQCHAQSAAAFSSCYDGCTSRECPGKSCVHSSCASGNCTCENPNARSCCESCNKSVSYASYSCLSSVQGGSHMYYCMLACTSNCNKNCV